MAAAATEELAARVEQLREQMGSVEAKLGVPSMDGAASLSGRYPALGLPEVGDVRRDARRLLANLPRAGGDPNAASGMPRGSALERIARLESRMDRVGETSEQAEVRGMDKFRVPRSAWYQPGSRQTWEGVMKVVLVSVADISQDLKKSATDKLARKQADVRGQRAGMS